MINFYIRQLEDEITFNYELFHVMDSYNHAVNWENKFQKDDFLKEENLSYINRLMDSYKKDLVQKK